MLTTPPSSIRPSSADPIPVTTSRNCFADIFASMIRQRVRPMQIKAQHGSNDEYHTISLISSGVLLESLYRLQITFTQKMQVREAEDILAGIDVHQGRIGNTRDSGFQCLCPPESLRTCCWGWWFRHLYGALWHMNSLMPDDKMWLQVKRRNSVVCGFLHRIRLWRCQTIAIWSFCGWQDKSKFFCKLF